MNQYHKIQTVFKRDPNSNYKTLLEGDFSLPEFEYLQNNEWEWEEKIDGTNLRLMFNGEQIIFGGKTDRAQLPAPLVAKLNRTILPQLDLFKSTFKDGGACLYCEGYGPGIQKGGKYRQDQDIALFDVKIGEWWLQRQDVVGIGSIFGIDCAPVIGHGTLDDMVEVVREGFKSTWGDFIAEGIVARPALELKSRNGSRIITKLKYKDFVTK
ncbi:MAG: hypothetical protein GY718_10040 [Lentisphaerae bacterium]|nr:hypothetical protein [Lentisphaerota bacterium]